MNVGQNPISSEGTMQQARNTTLLSMISGLLLGGVVIYVLSSNSLLPLWSLLPAFFGSLLALWLARRGRHIAGNMLLIGVVTFQMGLTPLFARGLGLPSALGSVASIGIIGLVAWPRRYIGRVLVIAIVIGMVVILADLFAPAQRSMSNALQAHWAFALSVTTIFLFLSARELYALDIRTKIVLGILATGGVSLVVLAFFSYDRATQAIEAVSGRLETSVKLLAEEQLINTVFTHADVASETFEDIMGDVADLSHYWVSLQSKQRALNQGSYWDASTSLIQLGGGQYGNSSRDASSVFIPVNTPVNDSLYADLNTSAYLDFYAPGILEAHPELLAVYAIDSRGVTRYYPNIELASILPADFDATKRPYYVITSPLFNPQRLPRWAIPYVDAAGGGLVVTVAAPVYIGEEFRGIVAADMTMESLTQQIRSLKIGHTGYAFLVDNAGRIISMPAAGYELFGIQPEEIHPEEFFRQTILGEGSDELQAVTRRMVAGGNGLLIVDAKGIDTYVSFAPIPGIGYSLGLVVPVSELQAAIETAHIDTQDQIQSALRLATLIFFALLLVAIAISLGIGQLLSAPIVRLTQTAEQIIGGDLTAQARINSRDEIGTLAEAFNTMTSRLRGILSELERRVADRTTALALANEKNERRARQFESIAQIANTISSTRDLDSLLPQITAAISSQFGFYHVGIFLLDLLGEYAVLSAANSEGGQRMLARNHKLRVGETGIVGFVTGAGEPRVALNTGEDSVFFNNPDLPETRSEMALPLRVGKEIFGALDVQSTHPNAFDQEDINILTTLADQVSIAIQNARQYEETRKALSEADSLSRQFVQTGWKQFTHRENLIGIRHSGARASLLYRKDEESPDQNDLRGYQSQAQTSGAAISVPIKLRGEVIGAVDIRPPHNRTWEKDELDIVTMIIERAALALENARLLQESQRRAAKETKIGEVTARIGASIDIRNVLQTAVVELGRAIPGSEVVIQFESEEHEKG